MASNGEGVPNALPVHVSLLGWHRIDHGVTIARARAAPMVRTDIGCRETSVRCMDRGCGRNAHNPARDQARRIAPGTAVARGATMTAAVG